MRLARTVTPRYSIVVVEDNRSDVYLLERGLTQEAVPFQLTSITDGGDALAFIRGEGVFAGAPVPDLILLDLNLPKLDAADLLPEIRNTPRLAQTILCVWSSSDLASDREKFGELGAAAYIVKPSNLQEFLAIGKVIKGLLEARSTEAAAQH